MSKIITSPVSVWQGTVTLKKPIPLPDVQVLERARLDIGKLDRENIVRADLDALMVKGIRACVEKWELDGGFVPDPFPGTPKMPSIELISWLWSEIWQIYNGEEGEQGENVPLA